MKKIYLIAGIILSSIIICPQIGNAARPIRMKMVTQYMDRHILVQKVYKPWIEQIKERTNGRVIIQLYNPNTIIPDGELWNGLVKDQIDIADHYLTRFPGVFPATTVTGKLPLAATNASVASAALWELVNTVPEMKEEFKEVKLLGVHSTSPLQVFTRSKEVKTLADMKNLKFIGAGKDTTIFARSLGVECIMQPGPDIYLALSRNMADGVIYPIPPTRSFKVDEACDYLLMSSIFTSPCFFAMSKTRWDSLPDDIKKVFEETSGEAMTKLLGAALDEGEKADFDVMVANGIKVNYLSDEEREQWRALAEDEMKATWLQEVEGKLTNSEEIYSTAKAVYAKYEAALSAK